VNDLAHQIKERFPDQKQIIDLLLKTDPIFLALCEDYDACVFALRHWAGSQEPEAETRRREYRTLVRELQDEINQFLERLISNRPT